MEEKKPKKLLGLLTLKHTQRSTVRDGGELNCTGTEDTERRVMEGQLCKYTNFAKGWQYRWFVMDQDSGMLEYFEKEELKKQRPRGFVNLAAAVISPSDEDSQTFTISATSGEIFRLRASDARERQLWVDKLRTTSEYHTSQMNNHGASRRSSQSLSLQLNDSTPAKRKTPSINLGTDKAAHPTAVSVRSQHKAPAPHPHTLDPFKEVREYIVDASDYATNLNDKINSLSQTEEPIGGLDKDLLLLKATSTATLTCLGQCLKMLQTKQGGEFPDIYTHQRFLSIGSLGDKSPRHGSVSSSSSLPFVMSDEKPEGPINHDDEVEDSGGYHEDELGGVEEHKSIILHLLSQLKLGMDLTKVVLPTFILERRSLLEMFADCMSHPDMFLKIPDLPDPESRMLAVIEWYLTSFHAARQGSVAKKPYNPIIGETFHCSWRVPKSKCKGQRDTEQSGDGQPAEGDSPQKSSQTSNKESGDVQLVYCAEQVSHHPPISAFYFECPEKQVSMNASIYTKSKFFGMSIGVNLIGKISLKLLDYDEEYIFGLPSSYARSILTVPWAELGDKITITCAKTNYSSTVTFHTKPFYGGKVHRVSAEVKNGKSGDIVCKVQGEWNNIMEYTFSDGQTKTIDVNDVQITKKRVRPIKIQSDYESRKLWEHVTNALHAGDVNTASEHKRLLEERQREGERHRKETGLSYPTKYFHKQDDQWIFNKLLQKGDRKGFA